jgi:hypothetical protein
VAGGPKSPGEPSRGLSRGRNERWPQFAERVANAFGLVLFLVLTTYVLASLTPFHGWTAVLTTLVAAAAGVVGLAGAQVRPVIVRTAAGAALVALILVVISAIEDSRHFLGASSFVLTLLMLIAAGAILRAVLLETEVGFRTILGAISVYAIFGILFTFLYAALDRIQSSPFFGTGASVKGGDFIFFSFTTLTTTGYGNLVPAAQPGKMFAGMEMLIGQIFLVTLVAGLVSLWRPGLLARERKHSG